MWRRMSSPDHVCILCMQRFKDLRIFDNAWIIKVTSRKAVKLLISLKMYKIDHICCSVNAVCKYRVYYDYCIFPSKCKYDWDHTVTKRQHYWVLGFHDFTWQTRGIWLTEHMCISQGDQYRTKAGRRAYFTI